MSKILSKKKGGGREIKRKKEENIFTCTYIQCNKRYFLLPSHGVITTRDVDVDSPRAILYTL